MGYSSRYHMASLVAVFVALAVGIVIGAAWNGARAFTATSRTIWNWTICAATARAATHFTWSW